MRWMRVAMGSLVVPLIGGALRGEERADVESLHLEVPGVLVGLDALLVGDASAALPCPSPGPGESAFKNCVYKREYCRLGRGGRGSICGRSSGILSLHPVLPPLSTISSLMCFPCLNWRIPRCSTVNLGGHMRRYSIQAKQVRTSHTQYGRIDMPLHFLPLNGARKLVGERVTERSLPGQ